MQDFNWNNHVSHIFKDEPSPASIWTHNKFGHRIETDNMKARALTPTQKL